MSLQQQGDDIYAGENDAGPLGVIDGDPTEQLYSELQRAYAFFNERLFEGKLPLVLITLQRRHHTEGYWSPQRFSNKTGTRAGELALNPCYFAVRTLLEVLANLVHQQVHVWQFHFGRPGRRGYHNREWANKMLALGLHPSSTDEPGGAETGEIVGHYIVAEGLFEKAAAVLISQDDFALTWYDRFPVPVAHPAPGRAAGAAATPAQPASQQPVSEPTREPGEDAADGPAPLEGSGGPGSGVLSVSNLVRANPAAGNAAEHSQAQPAHLYPALGLETKEEHHAARKTRHKFSCPACGDSAWGKPGLQLKCMKCDEPLRAADTVQKEPA